MYSAGKFVGSTSDSAENEYRSVHTETRSVVKFTNIVTEPDRVGGIPGRLYVYGTEHWNPSGSVPDPVGAKFEVKNGRCGKNPVGLNGKPVGCVCTSGTDHSSL